jgi:anthranilate phosphoribosyltransferase
MRHVAEVRRRLGFRTLFNLLGPLANPASPRYQLLGVGRPGHLDLLARSLAQLGETTAHVVCGSDGLDEVTLAGPTAIRKVQGGQVEPGEWTPTDFGLPRVGCAELKVRTAAESAERVRRALQGQDDAALHVILANAAAAVLTAGRVASLREGVALARDAVMSGAARAVLERWSRISQEPVAPTRERA